MTIFRIARSLGLAVGLAVILAGCSLAQPATLRPTLPPPPTLAPDATPVPTPAPCAGQAQVPAGETVVTLEDFPLADALEVTDVVWSGSRFVAVGFRSLPGEGYDGPRQGIVWTSCDGLEWQAAIDPQLQYITPIAVDALGEDVFVLGGLSTCGAAYEGICQDDVAEAGNILLRSTAGGPWQRLPQEPEMQAAYDVDMKAVGSRLAVYGSADDENVTYTLWLSSDGQAWQKTTDLAGFDPVDTLVADGEGLIAFGTLYPDDFEEGILGVATSSDGRQFTAGSVPDVPGAIVPDAAARPGGFAAVGVGYPEDGDFGVLGVALHSADGRNWTEAVATDGSFADSQLDNVHALPDGRGYVAVGYKVDSDDFTTQQGTLWHSADGRSWVALGEFGGDLSVYTTSAMGANGLVVFSADEDDSSEETETSVSAYFAPLGALVP